MAWSGNCVAQLAASERLRHFSENLQSLGRISWSNMSDQQEQSILISILRNGTIWVKTLCALHVNLQRARLNRIYRCNALATSALTSRCQNVHALVTWEQCLGTFPRTLYGQKQLNCPQTLYNLIALFSQCYTCQARNQLPFPCFGIFPCGNTHWCHIRLFLANQRIQFWALPTRFKQSSILNLHNRHTSLHNQVNAQYIF